MNQNMKYLKHLSHSVLFAISMNFDDPYTLLALSYCRVATATEQELETLANSKPERATPESFFLEASRCYIHLRVQ